MFNYILILSAIIFPSLNAAFEDSSKTNRPVMVFVSGDGCIPCERMKRFVLKPMEEAGEFQSVNLVFLNRDKDDVNLIDKLTNNDKSVPQTVLIFKKDGKWRQGRLVGAHQDNEVTKNKIRKLISLGRK